MIFKNITIVYLKSTGSKEIYPAVFIKLPLTVSHLLPMILRAFFQDQTQPNFLELVHAAILLFFTNTLLATLADHLFCAY